MIKGSGPVNDYLEKHKKTVVKEDGKTAEYIKRGDYYFLITGSHKRANLYGFKSLDELKKTSSTAGTKGKLHFESWPEISQKLTKSQFLDRLDNIVEIQDDIKEKAEKRVKDIEKIGDLGEDVEDDDVMKELNKAEEKGKNMTKKEKAIEKKAIEKKEIEKKEIEKKKALKASQIADTKKQLIDVAASSADAIPDAILSVEEDEDDKQIKLKRKDVKYMSKIVGDVDKSIIATNSKIDDLAHGVEMSLVELIKRFGNNGFMQLDVQNENPLSLRVSKLGLQNGKVIPKPIGDIIDEYGELQKIKDDEEKTEEEKDLLVIEKVKDITRKVNDLHTKRERVRMMGKKELIEKIHNLKV